MTSLCDLPASQIAELVRRRQVSAVEVLESCLERIRLVDGSPGQLPGLETKQTPQPESIDDGKVHALITLTEELAYAQAQEVDRALAKGDEPGPLAGVPLTVKDIFCVKGIRTTAASRMLANYYPPYSATPVAKLRESGGVMLGKVNLDEFAYGSSNESTAFKPEPRNPWDTMRAPGGSSGGSAAALAAGIGALSLGSDTSGSIRQPAAFCGVVGLKPTYGRVSRYGLIAFGSSLDCPGPMARNITDAALMLHAIAGADPKDSTAVNSLLPDFKTDSISDLHGIRIGISPDFFKITHPDPETGSLAQFPISYEIESNVLKAAEKLAAMGAEIIEDVPMPNIRYGIPAYFVISRVEAASNLHRFDGIKYGYRAPDTDHDLQTLYRRSRGQGFGLHPKMRILMGMYVSAAQYDQGYYPRAQKVRAMIRRDFEDAFDPLGPFQCQALLTPTTPTTAFPAGDAFGNSVEMQYADQFTVPANHAGIPALSLPCGIDSNGLPIGLQLIGSDFSEIQLLQIGRAFEMMSSDEPWRSLRPQVLSLIKQ